LIPIKGFCFVGHQSKKVFDEGAGRTLYALQITQNINYLYKMYTTKLINETSTSYSGQFSLVIINQILIAPELVQLILEESPET